MSEYLLKNENFVPAKIAAKRVGYTTDYVTRLAREEKIPAKKDGTKWVVDADAVAAFAEEAEEDRALRGRALRVERKTELLLRTHETQVKDFGLTVVPTPNLGVGRARAFAETVLILGFGLLIGSVMYYSPNYEYAEQHVAGIHESGITFLEEIARSFYAFITPDGRFVQQTVEEKEAQEVPVQKHRSYGVVVEEGRTLSDEVVSDAFSDEVHVDFDTEVFDSGIVTPRFENGDGDAYRFKILLEEISLVPQTEE